MLIGPYGVPVATLREVVRGTLHMLFRLADACVSVRLVIVYGGGAAATANMPTRLQ